MRPRTTRSELRANAPALLAVTAILLAARGAAAHDNTVVHRGMADLSVARLGNPFFVPYASDIRAGSHDEDVPATRTLGHFYNPQTDSAPWFALGAGPAWQNGQEQYDAALQAYANGNLTGTDAAFHRLGRALHFIQDMTSPAHVHDDQHATDDEDFEAWGPANFYSFDYSGVAPKFAAVRTAAGFIREVARLTYDLTSYQVDIDEHVGPQPPSEFKDMFPSLHWEDGGFLGDDVWVVDRIGTFDCYGNGVFCNDGWWVIDETKIEDQTGRGGSRRLRGFAYVENTGGNSAEPVPLVFKGVPNTANEPMRRIYGRLLYPEAIAYGAGLLQVFAEAVGAPPTPTPTPTRTATPTPTPATGGSPSPTPPGTPTATPTPLAPTVTPTATPTPTVPLLCGPTPRAGCRAALVPAKGSLLVKDRAGAFSDLVQWKWSSGAATASGDFGDPVTATNFAVCLYDAVGGVPALRWSARMPAGGECGGRPCWKALGERGFKYHDPALTPDGVHKAQLKPGPDGRARIQVIARGPVLAWPVQVNGRVLGQEPLVVVQLVSDVPGGACWESRFSAPASVSTFEQFFDRSD